MLPTMYAGDALRAPGGQSAQTFFRVQASPATRPRAPDASVGPQPHTNAIMKITKIIALASGLGALVIVIVLGMLTVNDPALTYVALLGMAIATLAPIGLELCRFAFQAGAKEYHLFSRGYRGYAFDMLSVLLAIGLTIATVNYQHTSQLLCDGRLSAGFPLAFICDASGESPLSSVGKIDWADLDSINRMGSFIDILLYLTLIETARFAVSRFSNVATRPMKSN
jgi:hypothetical protein